MMSYLKKILFGKKNTISYNYDKINNITHDTLDLQMKLLPNKFEFIKCLDNLDKDMFINEYLYELNDDIIVQEQYFNNGVIKTSTFFKIMSKIDNDLKCHYCIYRTSYWKENIKREYTSITRLFNIKTNYVSKLIEFGNNYFDIRRLLINNNNISRMHFYKESEYVNKDVWFFDVII